MLEYVYIDGCLFEAVGFTERPNTYKPEITVIGKAPNKMADNGGTWVDEFMFWENVLKAAEVMSVYINDH